MNSSERSHGNTLDLRGDSGTDDDDDDTQPPNDDDGSIREATPPTT